jgi:hypothetical protein
MSLVKKNRINHFRKNKQNVKKRAKAQTEGARKLTAHMKSLSEPSGAKAKPAAQAKG